MDWTLVLGGVFLERIRTSASLIGGWEFCLVCLRFCGDRFLGLVLIPIWRVWMVICDWWWVGCLIGSSEGGV